MAKAKSTKLCSVEGCSKPFYAKEICKQHYMYINKSRFFSNNPKVEKKAFDVEDYWLFVKKELNIG